MNDLAAWLLYQVIDDEYESPDPSILLPERMALRRLIAKHAACDAETCLPLRWLTHLYSDRRGLRQEWRT
jgi:hypothetical protein